LQRDGKVRAKVSLEKITVAEVEYFLATEARLACRSRHRHGGYFSLGVASAGIYTRTSY
jgi:hypothetical protein